MYSDLVVRDDIPRLGTFERRQIKDTIQIKLTSAPEQFGKPLQRPHNGYWSLRVGSYRIIYMIKGNMVRVLVIQTRGEVYETLSKRI